ncbi:MAG: hypothetical protein V4726_22640 [Verrucomicrobiota bacterium]
MKEEQAPAAARKILTPAVMAGLKRELSSIHANARDARHRTVRQRVLYLIGRGDLFETYIDPFRWAAIQSLTADLPVDEIRGLAATLLEEKGGSFIAETLFTRWAELDPDEARQAALEQVTGPADYGPLLGTLRVMARGDFAGTLRWAKANAPEFCRDDILLSLIQPLAAADPRAYVKWSTDPSTSPGKSKVNTVGAPPPSPGEALCRVLPYDTSFALNGLRQGERDGSLKFPVYPLGEDLMFKGQLKPSQAETMEAFARDLPPESALRGQLLITAAITLADSQPSRAADLLTAARPDSREPDNQWLGLMGSLLRDWQDRDMPSALDWQAAHPDLNLDPDVLSELVRRNRLRMPEKTKSSPVVTP